MNGNYPSLALNDLSDALIKNNYLRHIKGRLCWFKRFKRFMARLLVSHEQPRHLFQMQQEAHLNLNSSNDLSEACILLN